MSISSDKDSNICVINNLFPDLTVNDMMKLVEDKLQDMYIPRFVAKFFTKDIPQLKRWQK